MDCECKDVYDKMQATRGQKKPDEAEWLRDSVGYKNAEKAWRDIDEIAFATAARLFKLCCGGRVSLEEAVRLGAGDVYDLLPEDMGAGDEEEGDEPAPEAGGEECEVLIY